MSIWTDTLDRADRLPRLPERLLAFLADGWAWFVDVYEHRGRIDPVLLTLTVLGTVLISSLGWKHLVDTKDVHGRMYVIRPAEMSRATALTGDPQTAALLGIDAFVSTAARPLDAEGARLWNARLPVSNGPNPAADAFLFPALERTGLERATDCLTAAVYYESANESDAGQRAVAQVVLNRVAHPAYPKSVCGVVFQGYQRRTGCQFSFTCDGSLARTPRPATWDRARLVAKAALNGSVMAAVGHATHYHADYVAPYWAPSLTKVGQIGAHIFYRWRGRAGTPSAFNGAHSGVEPQFSLSPQTSTSAAVDETAAADAFALGTEVAAITAGAEGEATVVQTSPAEGRSEVYSDVAATQVALVESSSALEATASPPVAPVVETTPAFRPASNPISAPTAPARRPRVAIPSAW